ncbi:hypothetical protein MMC30_003534 [Trapelia coarctata]|nr:hypothetical protein [Trapelia coarctata]
MHPVVERGLIGCYMLAYQPSIWYFKAKSKRRIAKYREATLKRIHEVHIEKTTRPLGRVRARTRERALTIPLSEDPADGTTQSTSDQAQSYFFSKLPFELRLHIYLDLLCQKEENDVMHLSSTKDRLHHVRCTEGDRIIDNRVGWQHGCWAMYAVAAKDCACNQMEHGHGVGVEHPSQNEKLLALLQTCRRAYSEAINILYTDNSFSIRQDTALIHLATLVPPHRLNLIKTLHCDFILDFRTYRRSCNSSPDVFDSWEETWHILAGMRGLQTLQVTITKLGATQSLATTYQIMSVLAPLKAVTGVKGYGVDLMFEVPEDLERRLGEVPFQLRCGREVYAGVTPGLKDVSCNTMGYAAMRADERGFFLL